jgi:hypothetical protein
MRTPQIYAVIPQRKVSPFKENSSVVAFEIWKMELNIATNVVYL